jgi:hypothetical protein
VLYGTERCFNHGSKEIPVREYQDGALARVLFYERNGGRCPACDFLDQLTAQMRKRFDGSFLALITMGSDYCNQQRFKALHDRGKPLWEFKEHGARLYCSRGVAKDSKHVRIVLLHGWTKDKAGRSQRENREIEKALNLLREFELEQQGGRR